MQGLVYSYHLPTVAGMGTVSDSVPRAEGQQALRVFTRESTAPTPRGGQDSFFEGTMRNRAHHQHKFLREWHVLKASLNQRASKEPWCTRDDAKAVMMI